MQHQRYSANSELAFRWWSFCNHAAGIHRRSRTARNYAGQFGHVPHSVGGQRLYTKPRNWLALPIAPRYWRTPNQSQRLGQAPKSEHFCGWSARTPFGGGNAFARRPLRNDLCRSAQQTPLSLYV